MDRGELLMAVDRLVDSTQLNTDLTSIANAIRTKGGTSAQLAFPSDFITAINAISGGGGDVWEPILDHTVTINLKDDTSFDSKTPSTSAQEIYAAVNGVQKDGVKIETAAVDFNTYSYLGIAVQTVNFAWLSEPANTNVPRINFSVTRIFPNRYLRDVYELWNVTKAACFYKSDGSFQNRNYGVPAGGVGFSTNSTNTSTPKFSLQISKINLQANATYFPVADVEKIDSANTNIYCTWKLYRCARTAIDEAMHNLVRSMLYPE
jgi:hypothetical protein